MICFPKEDEAVAVELAKLDSMDLLPMKGQHPKPYINHLQTLFKQCITLWRGRKKRWETEDGVTRLRHTRDGWHLDLMSGAEPVLSVWYNGHTDMSDEGEFWDCFLSF